MQSANHEDGASGDPFGALRNTLKDLSSAFADTKSELIASRKSYAVAPDDYRISAISSFMDAGNDDGQTLGTLCRRLFTGQQQLFVRPPLPPAPLFRVGGSGEPLSPPSAQEVDDHAPPEIEPQVRRNAWTDDNPVVTVHHTHSGDDTGGTARLAHSAPTDAVPDAVPALDAPVYCGSAPAVVAAAMVGLWRCVELLLEFNVAVNAVDGSRRTALHYAAAAGNAEVCRALARAGASLSASDADGRTAVMLASFGGHVGTLTALLELHGEAALVEGATAGGLEGEAGEAGGDVEGGDDGEDGLPSSAGEPTALESDVLGGGGEDVSVGVVRSLEGDGKGQSAQSVETRKAAAIRSALAKQDSTGDTALHLAVAAPSLACVQTLLAHGVDVDAVGAARTRALITAAWDGDDAIVAELLSRGASVDTQNASGYTAAMGAVRAKALKTLMRLLDANCTTHLEDNDGRDALAHALIKGVHSAAAALRLRGARLPRCAESLLPPNERGAARAAAAADTSAAIASRMKSARTAAEEQALDAIGYGSAPGSSTQVMFEAEAVGALSRPVWVAEHTVALLKPEVLRHAQWTLMSLAMACGWRCEVADVASPLSPSDAPRPTRLTVWADDSAVEAAVAARVDCLSIGTARGSGLSHAERAESLRTARALYAARRVCVPYTFAPTSLPQGRGAKASSDLSVVALGGRGSVAALLRGRASQLHTSDSLMEHRRVPQPHPWGLSGASDGPLSGLWCSVVAVRAAARPLVPPKHQKPLMG